MAIASPALARNVVRRTFSQLVDPAPDAGEIDAIWKYFESRCAYCDKVLNRGMKEAHIDHLVSASLGGANHISNRVLACAACNEKEKRDTDWKQFLESKGLSPDDLSARSRRIEDWLVLHQRELSDDEAQLLNAAIEAAAEVNAVFSAKYESIRELKRKFNKQQKSAEPTSRSSPSSFVPVSVGREAGALPKPKARYAFSRLCFKADVIEPLEPADHFRIDTPDGSFQLSKEEFIRDFGKVIETRSYREGGIYHYPVPPQHTWQYLVRDASVPLTLEQIIAQLDRHHQRATYGAVSSLVGTIARSLMQSRPRSHTNSWIVSQATGLPTGYEPEQMHPSLRENPHLIRSGTELAQWLDDLAKVKPPGHTI